MWRGGWAACMLLWEWTLEREVGTPPPCHSPILLQPIMDTRGRCWLIQEYFLIAAFPGKG